MSAIKGTYRNSQVTLAQVPTLILWIFRMSHALPFPAHCFNERWLARSLRGE
jgi:hypothetical protein